MTEDELAEMTEIGAIAMSHTALLTALFGVLEQKSLLTKHDISGLLDAAMLGLENAVAHGANPAVMDRSRKVLENTVRNLSGGPKSRSGKSAGL